MTTGSVLVALGSSPEAWVEVRSHGATSVFSQTQVRFCISFCSSFPETPFVSSQFDAFLKHLGLCSPLEPKTLVVLSVHLVTGIIPHVLQSETMVFHYKFLGSGKVPATQR